MANEPTRERVVVVHHARSTAEAAVVRGLLESAGIASPAPTATDPFPLRDTPKGTHGVEIQVLESQAEDARRIIGEYLSADDGAVTSDE